MSTENGLLLEVTDLRKEFAVRSGFFIERVSHTVNAVDGVGFSIAPGRTLGLVGESGSGKSTTGYCVLQLLKPTSGSVLFEGEELTKLGRDDVRRLRRDMQIVFQDPYSSLNPRMTVGDIVGEPLVVHSVGSRRDRQARVRELLDVVGFNPGFSNRYPHEFSGGQRQRIGVARALALNPKLIVCDEPVSALDVSIQAQILNLLSELKDQFGLTLIFISHNLSVVRHVSDRILVLYLGRMVELASGDDLYDDPKHPYTKALLTAVPIADPKRARLRNIDALTGEIPSPINPPSGCTFRTRCRYAIGICAEKRPPLETAGGDRLVACHRWQEIDHMPGMESAAEQA